MTRADYKTKRIALETQFDKEVAALNNQYVIENAEFKVGDFIYNVTGIIKVEQIDCYGEDFPTIFYYGRRYKKRYGKLIPTKHQEKGRLYSYGNPKKIENPIPVKLL